MFRKVLLAAVIGASFATVPLESFAQRPVVITVAPPAPRQEAVPAARRGHVWVPGHYVWHRGRHQWVRGSWLRERRGYAYNEPRWVERNGRWELHRGRWVRGGGGGMRDRDGDGVPNRFDSRPNNPNRR